ncbi:MAG: DUF2177 family protein [Pseudomonadota bacterium]
MQLLVLYLSSAGFFLIVDAIALTLLLKPLFDRHLGDIMASPIDLTAAVIFYLSYIAGILYFAALPALRADSIAMAAMNGALLGAFAYGTYELTNKATLRDWDWSLVAVDLTWGAILTGATAAFGVWATKAITG